MKPSRLNIDWPLGLIIINELGFQGFTCRFVYTVFTRIGMHRTAGNVTVLKPASLIHSP